MSERRISLVLTFIFILLALSTSFSIYKYSNSPEFIEIDGLGVNSQKITLELDEIIVKGDLIKLNGWAIVRGIESKMNDKKIVLMDTSNEKKYELVSTRDVKRTDVTSHFNNSMNYNNSGFDTEIPKENLKKGKYRIGILISDDSGSIYKMGRETISLP